jgi:ankyrin repeat protein
MTNRYLIPALIAAVVAPSIAHAQFSDSFNFLKAVRDRDGTKVTDLLNKPGTVIVNTRDGATSETALHIVTSGRDIVWLGFLLQRGANPNLRDTQGRTPLLIATELRWAEGVQTLLRRSASVDIANGNGETALSKAVQNNDVAIVRLLLAAGANPARADNAGFSPRDLAKRDARLTPLLKEMDAAKAVSNKPVQGPH